MLITIKLVGCDDTTELALDATKEEIDLLKQVAAQLTEVSSCPCKPKMYIFEEGNVASNN